MSAHTLEQWRVLGATRVVAGNGEKLRVISDVADPANARLIAASPDIYEALVAALPYLVAVQETFDERGRDVVLRATAALARVPS